MADNFEVPDFSNNKRVVATDQVEGVDYQILKLAHGDRDVATLASDANPFPVSLQASNKHLGEVGGKSDFGTGFVTRPANTTTYAAGQAIQNASPSQISIPVARLNGGSGIITGVRLTKSSPTVGATFRLYVMRNAMSGPPADGVAFSTANGLAGRVMFKCDITIDEAYADGAEGFYDFPMPRIFKCRPDALVLFGYLVAKTSYTPASGEVFEVSLFNSQD